METKIIKVGNSKGVRLSRAYLERIGVDTGDKVEVTITKKAPDYKRALAALHALAAKGGIKAIKDPVAWQREQRRDRPLPRQ